MNVKSLNAFDFYTEDDTLQLQQFGICDNTKLFVWDGKMVGKKVVEFISKSLD